ncbi:MAG: 2,3-bisphosphoglycerate-independent phosphoglycerate mutase [Firmicutes bacterium]|nr:2,3-bisphosphoglycerate-independent phosphoglycerate mutase [Bacillota bacterium]
MGKVLLIILDGLGVSGQKVGNAAYGHMPYLDSLREQGRAGLVVQTKAGQGEPSGSAKQYTCLYTTLGASGQDVGLLGGIMGNSEVGHLNIGAGRVVKQMALKISKNFDSSAYESFLAGAKNNRLHIMGLLSDGLVHSSIEHLKQLITLFSGKYQIFIHAFLDGRDVPPKSALTYLDRLNAFIASNKDVCLASITGRYYAMDRDNRVERTNAAVDLLKYGKASDKTNDKVNDNADSKNIVENFKTYSQAVNYYYSKGVTDEFIPPTPLADFSAVQAGDSIINFNFRADRAKQLSKHFCCEFKGVYNYAGFVKYNSCCNYIYKGEIITNTLTEVLAAANKSQLKVAETEKYAHITYFFNGQRECEYALERRVLIPSNRQVATYDLAPEMSAKQITDAVKKELGGYDFILLNYANCDMVGHTGNFKATEKACAVVDNQLKELVPLAIEQGYIVIVTADHGNAEQMLDKNGKPQTSHSTNPVPFLLIMNYELRIQNCAKNKELNSKTKNASPTQNITLKQNGILADIAPTILQLMRLQKPPEMTGNTLLLKNNMI